MSCELTSTDSNATITEFSQTRTRQWRAVDLFCPHPHLLALARNPRPAPRPVLAQLLDNPGLLSTTAFRTHRPTQPLRPLYTQPLRPRQAQPLRPQTRPPIQESRARLPPTPIPQPALPQPAPPQPTPRRPAPEFRSLVVTLLELWRDIPPSQYPFYAARLRPILYNIFNMYLRWELELTYDELVQVRALGRAVIEYSRGPGIDLEQLEQAEGSRSAEVDTPMDAGLDRQPSLARSNAVRHRITSRGGPGAYSTNEAIQAWMGGM